ncbi:MAG: 16S rRNA (cytosine(1402)-N(4))-methyltransferase RsmH [Candidatus Saccharibacteria bacterium]
MRDVPDDQVHIPVLLDLVLQYLAPQIGDSYVDMTAGYGGHASAVLKLTHNPKGMILVDRDQQAITALQPLVKQGAKVIHSDFLQASQQLADAGKQYDMVLADLGVSSPHLNTSSRGFSFASDAELDMRMDQRQTLSAADIVNSYPEAELADIIWRFGEEPKSRQIARMIVQNRPFTSTTELAKVVARAWPGHSKVHPATRSFQALRIVVNDELTQLEQALPLWIDLLKPGGRLAVISFHSLEDRVVKRTLAEYAEGYEAQVTLLTKSPVSGSDQEIVFNPRARSAKLRAAAKIKKKGN